MEFTDYLIWKLVALAVLAFLGNFFFTLITGKTIDEARQEQERNGK